MITFLTTLRSPPTSSYTITTKDMVTTKESKVSLHGIKIFYSYTVVLQTHFPYVPERHDRDVEKTFRVNEVLKFYEGPQSSVSVNHTYPVYLFTYLFRLSSVRAYSSTPVVLPLQRG